MPEREVYWICDTCRQRYASYETASMCESGHIVSNAIQSFREDVARINFPSRAKATRKAKP